MNKDLELVRFAWTPDGTFGSMMIDGIEIFTVERPWLENRKGISCIPKGEYICRSRPYYKGGYDTFEVTDVRNRSHILIHKGNTDRDVRGCIAVGADLGMVDNRWAVTKSKEAFNHFFNHFEGFAEFKLTISNISEQG